MQKKRRGRSNSHGGSNPTGTSTNSHSDGGKFSHSLCSKPTNQYPDRNRNPDPKATNCDSNEHTLANGDPNLYASTNPNSNQNQYTSAYRHSPANCHANRYASGYHCTATHPAKRDKPNRFPSQRYGEYAFPVHPHRLP